jgi:Uma2 family endonuclease
MAGPVRGTSALKHPDRYTYRDRLNWPDDERWELIDGVAYDMSPAPRWLHQAILTQLSSQLDTHFSGKLCRPSIAPVDVFLVDEGESIDDAKHVVQPDLLVVCDRDKIVDQGVVGAPDFIIEILSPGTAMKDQTEKRKLYEAKGVREYWIINPDTLELFIYTLKQDGVYGLPSVADIRTPVGVEIFEGLFLQVREGDLV